MKRSRWLLIAATVAALCAPVSALDFNGPTPPGGGSGTPNNGSVTVPKLAVEGGSINSGGLLRAGVSGFKTDTVAAGDIGNQQISDSHLNGFGGAWTHYKVILSSGDDSFFTTDLSFSSGPFVKGSFTEDNLKISGTAPSDGDTFLFDSTSGGFRKSTPFTAFWEYAQFDVPEAVSSPGTADGVGCSTGTSLTMSSRYFGKAQFSGTAAKTANYAEFTMDIPLSIDTNTIVRAEDIAIALSSATDTGKMRFEISMATMTASATTSPTLGNAVTLDLAGDASGALNDYEHIAATDLTGWAAAMTPGATMLIRIARVGDDTTNDTSTAFCTLLKLAIRFAKTHP